MLDFLKNYYHLIILILALVILIIELILSFRIKPNQNVLSFIDKIVPEMIINAEEKYGASHGEDKRMYVFRCVATALSDVFNIKDAGKYENYIYDLVEKVLSTPAKKKEVI